MGSEMCIRDSFNAFCNFKGIYGFHGNRKVPFLKITVAIPRLIAPAKRLLEQGFTCPGYSSHGFQAYESNIDFEVRLAFTTFGACEISIEQH